MEALKRQYQQALEAMLDGAASGRMRINHPNMEQVARPVMATVILEPEGTVYEITSLPTPGIDG